MHDNSRVQPTDVVVEYTKPNMSNHHLVSRDSARPSVSIDLQGNGKGDHTAVHVNTPPPSQAVISPSGIRGNPGPFGLLGFGMTTCMLCWVTANWTKAGFVPVVLAYALFYGGLGQFIAGLFELIRGSTFAGTAFSSYGCFWMGWALWKWMEITTTVPSVAKMALTGDTLWCGLWSILTLGFFVVTLRKNHCLMTIFSTLTITFALLAGANYSPDCKLAAGYIGIFCGGSAIYAALAMLYQDELGFNVWGLKPVKYI